MKLKYAALAMILAVVGCMSTAFAQVKYTFDAVNYPEDTFTQLLGINNGGEIAGYHGAAINKGFTYSLSTRTFTNENYPNSMQTQVIGINGQGPFKTSGFYITQSNQTIGFTDVGGSFTSVAFPGTPFNQLLSQNNEGQAAGYFSTAANGSAPDHPYVYDEIGNVFEEFFMPNSSGGAQATGINNSGDVCGFFIDSKQVNHGWLRVFGHVSTLNYPDSTGTQALGLNNEGQVVGSYTDASGNSHGFVYNYNTKVWQTVDDPNGVNSTIVNGINDKGQLVGFYGMTASSPTTSYGFVATPE
jgi:probable HAF family extracellular repeat protein